MADAKPQSPVDKARSAEDARRAAETAEWLATAAVIVLVINVVAGFGLDSLRDLRELEETPALLEQINTVLRVWIWALPPLLFVGALDCLRKALREFAQGRYFSPASARAVRFAGEYAVVAVIAGMVISPTLQAWTGGAHRGIVWNIEQVDIALIAFAVFVSVIGRILDLAVAIKAENDEIV